MKNIISYLVITTIALMSSDSLSMLIVFTQSTRRQSKNIPYAHVRHFTCVTLLEKQYLALRKKNRIHEEKLRLLRQDPYENIRKIWQLEDEIKKNKRMLATYKLKILNETTE